jgi:hypothetical protein
MEVARIDHKRIIASVSIFRKQNLQFLNEASRQLGKPKANRCLAATRLLQYRPHERFSAAAANVGALSMEGEDHG